MQRILAYPLTVLHFLYFGLIILIFHPIQWFCFHVLGYEAHKRSVDVMNYLMLTAMWPLGNTFKQVGKLPVKGKSYIFISNHQSLYDIPPLSWFLRQHHPKFISKIELMKAGIPSISYNLKVGRHANIDRNDSRQAIAELIRFGRETNETGRSIIIFPEGTRSKTGNLKTFKRTGLKTLFKIIPDAEVVPVTLNNSWKIAKYGKFPYGLGNKITLTVHESISLKGQTADEVIDRAEKIIAASIKSTISSL